MLTKNIINLLLAAIFFAAALLFIDAEPQVQQGMAIFVTVAWLWISQALPISTTALLIPVMALGSGLLPASEAFENFASPVIFLFMGGFALAASLQKYGLDQLFALKMLSLAGGAPLNCYFIIIFSNGHTFYVDQ